MSENIAFCFDYFFNPETGGDCLVGTLPDTDSVKLWTKDPNPGIQKLIYDKVSTIQNRMECYVLLIMELSGKNVRTALCVHAHSLKAKIFSNAKIPEIVCISSVHALQYALVPVNFGSQTALIVEIMAYGSVVSI